MAKTGRYRAVSIGAGLLMAFISIEYSRLTPETPFLLILTLQVVYGLAAAVVTSVYLMAIQAHMPERLLSAATAGMQLVQTIGGTVGAAVLGAIAASDSYSSSMPLLFRTAAVLAVLAAPASLGLSAKKL